MKKVYFTNRFNNVEVEVRLSDNQYLRLITNKYYNPYELYINDCNRVFAGENPLIFSKNQIKRIDSFLQQFDPICIINVDGKIYDNSDSF